MVSWAEHEREHKIEAMHERNARLAALREVREMVKSKIYGYGSIDLYNDGHDAALESAADDIDELIKAEEAK